MAKLPLHRTEPKIGPSDTSDTFSDRPEEPSTDTDDGLTGERPTTGIDPHSALNNERGTDRVVGPLEAGLAGGLDEDEEADIDPVGPTPQTRRKKRPEGG